MYIFIITCNLYVRPKESLTFYKCKPTEFTPFLTNVSVSEFPFSWRCCSYHYNFFLDFFFLTTINSSVWKQLIWLYKFGF